jgi:hypothetical protein
LEHQLIEIGAQVINLEHRAGFEPANAGFADLSVCLFATGAFDKPEHLFPTAEPPPPDHHSDGTFLFRLAI